MSKLIEGETRVELQKVFEGLVSPVKLIFFTQENACPACAQQRQLLEEFASMSEKLELVVHDFVLHGDEALNYGVDKIPATVVTGEGEYKLRFYGLTVGYEFSSLVQAVLMVSSRHSGLDAELEELVRNIREKVHIQVMVTLTCPYCPKMVHVAHQFALVNTNIQADMVEASQFPQLTQKYNVTAVPKTIINETHSFEGALPAETVYMEILKAANPAEYGRLREVVREFEGERKTVAANENHEYETIIVGGGPAAMSAAIYSVRKGLDVVLIAKKLGGQIENTAKIDNYLGMPEQNGSDLAEAFRRHVESYPIAEVLGSNVMRISMANGDFIAATEDNHQFKGKSVIYCAGKEYDRLGVPGEDIFLGKGIGFCATCDAPLYQGKRVAVVGGGNSAFTAARDMLSFASEVHLIHRKSEFKADVGLAEDVINRKNVTLHKGVIVHSFLGKEKLTGVRLESIDGKNQYDVNVDGVFLEIGLTPNTAPLKGLIELNEKGEVPVGRDQSTKIEGLFAAGDVTDVEEKQISIAVGHGAIAALTACSYLAGKGVTGSKINLKEPWE